MRRYLSNNLRARLLALDSSMRWLIQSRDFAGHLLDKPVDRPFREQYPFHELDLASPNVTVEASHFKWTRVSALFMPVFRPSDEWAVAQESPQT